MRFKKGFLILFLIVLSACGQAGWKGYYMINPDKDTDKYIAQTSANFKTINVSNNSKIILQLPLACSEFFTTGFITPFTPPFPIAWFRSWHWSGHPCNFFTAETKPQATLHLKTIDSKTNQEIILAPTSTQEGRWGYTKHIFPIKAKNLDSGTLIIEKDGQKVEVPFEYKYFKFWY